MKDPQTNRVGETTIGLEIHANLLAQMLDTVMLKKIPDWCIWLIALGVVLLGALTAVSNMKIWKLSLVLLIQSRRSSSSPSGGRRTASTRRACRCSAG